MSYRTNVNDIQIFGNNECYPEWIDFIKSQGIEVDEDYGYRGEITDIMGAITAIEKIILRLEAERREKQPISTSLFDFRKDYDEIIEQDIKFPNDDYNTSLTDQMMELRKNAYIFMPCLFIDACGDMIEPDKPFTVPRHFMCYKVKEGCKIKVSAG